MTTRAVILGAGQGFRFVDADRSYPAALAQAGPERSVLSWILHSLASQGIDDITYVGGYHLEKVVASAPHIAFAYHEGWRSEGDLAGLLHVAPVPGDLLLLHGATVLTPAAVEALLGVKGASVCGELDGPDCLLVRADQVDSCLAQVRRLVSQRPEAGIADLSAALNDVTRVDLDGAAARISDHPAVLKLVFQGKARTLEQLQTMVRSATVLDQARFTVTEWRNDPGAVRERIRALGSETVVIRSTTRSEDGLSLSGAGQYESVLDVQAADDAALSDAIGKVIASYGRDGGLIADDEEVMAQPQVLNVTASGVLFTRDLVSGAPIYSINIDRDSDRTDGVTSGRDGGHDTCFVSWAAQPESLPGDIAQVITLAGELQELTRLDALDIEFCIDRGGMLYLLQVRPMPAAGRTFGVADGDLLDSVRQVHDFVAEQSAPRAGLSGGTTMFGNMPDWNPAEMIGTTPRPLALSLYQSLIGDYQWAAARAEIGYRDVTPEPLVVSLAGRPYVDVRTSLNSFLPATLEEDIAGPWIDDCLLRLRNEPHLHDKVEFRILPTCLSFDWETHAGRMRAAGLSREQTSRYRHALADLTTTMLNGGEQHIAELLSRVERLEASRQLRTVAGDASASLLARHVQLMMVDCGRFGLRPFSILARYAFVSLALLRSLVERGVIDESQQEAFMRSVPTVAGEFTLDLQRFENGELGREDLLARYGHLRPNSYEITSDHYAADFERYFGQALTPASEALAEPDLDMARIDAALEELGLPVEAGTLLQFMRSSIAARERAKFEFMKTVNSILETISHFGAALGLDRESLSYLRIEDLLQFSRSSLSQPVSAQLGRLAGFRRKQMVVTRALRLPDLLRDAGDVLFFEQERWKPNFVTRRSLTAEAVDLSNSDTGVDLAGRIVLIQAADPGYDWIFGHGIAGLLTEYGGMGSHMAIRAAEFGLPAAIGCGESLFEELRTARRIELDCANERVRGIA